MYAFNRRFKRWDKLVERKKKRMCFLDRERYKGHVSFCFLLGKGRKRFCLKMIVSK